MTTTEATETASPRTRKKRSDTGKPKATTSAKDFKALVSTAQKWCASPVIPVTATPEEVKALESMGATITSFVKTYRESQIKAWQE